MNDRRVKAFEGEIPSAVRLRAAEWLAQREARGFTAQEHADFAEWLGADVRHRAAFAEIAAGWTRLDGLAAYPHSPDTAPDPELLAMPGRRGRWHPVAVGTAALATAAAIMVAAVWTSRPPADDLRSHPPAVAVGKTVPAAQTLRDGSMVELNAGGEVTEHFTPTERRVRLVRGEAHFTVTPNPARPFVVEAGGVTLRAVGTAFNVRLERDSVDVLVTHGRVKVTPAGGGVAAATAEPILEAQQQVTLPREAAPAALAVKTLPAPEVQRALSWQTNRIVFDDMPLADVIARFNRARSDRGPRIAIADPQLGALRFSGRLRADDLEGLLEVLEVSFGLTAQRDAGGEIVLLRR